MRPVCQVSHKSEKVPDFSRQNGDSQVVEALFCLEVNITTGAEAGIAPGASRESHYLLSLIDLRSMVLLCILAVLSFSETALPRIFDMEVYDDDTHVPPQTAPPPLVEMRGIAKRFPGVLVLCDVDFDVIEGEVHALIGENDAGKSILVKILAGVYTRDAGEVIFQGQPVHFTKPRQAQVAGIATIYQELNRVPQLSVTENIFLGTEIEPGIALNWAEMHRRARELLAKLHIALVIYAIGWLVLPHTQLGRYTYAMGGIMVMGRLQSGAYQNGTSMTLTSVAAVVIGGTSLSGGVGGIWGSLVGVFIMRLVEAGLVYLSVPFNPKEIVIGALLCWLSGWMWRGKDKFRGCARGESPSRRFYNQPTEPAYSPASIRQWRPVDSL
jgi:ABC transporter